MRWPEGQALPSFSQPEEPLRGVSLLPLSDDARLTLAALQGLVNRKKTRLYLYGDHALQEGLETWPQRLGLRVEEERDLFALIGRFAPELAGVVLSNVSFALGAGDGSAAFPLEGAVSAASLIEEIETLILSKAYALTLGYTGEEGSKLAAQAQLRIHAAEGLALTGKVNVTYGTLNLPLSVTLAGDTVYLSLYNIKLSATFAELESAVEKLLPLAGVQLPQRERMSRSDHLGAATSSAAAYFETSGGMARSSSRR